MANEASVQSMLRVNKGNLHYQSQPNSFNATVTGSGGPSPGSLSIGTTYETISLPEIATPGLFRVMNLDTTNYVEMGVEVAAAFYPLLKILAGETYVGRLRGSGSTIAMKANTAACIVLFEVFAA